MSSPAVENVRRIGRTVLPVRDQDAAIAFYTGVLGMELRADVPFGPEEARQRWVEVAPPGGEATIALGRPPVPSEEFAPASGVCVALDSADFRADHAALQAAGVDLDPVMEGALGAPTMVFLRDPDGNALLLVDAAEPA